MKKPKKSRDYYRDYFYMPWALLFRPAAEIMNCTQLATIYYCSRIRFTETAATSFCYGIRLKAVVIVKSRQHLIKHNYRGCLWAKSYFV